MALTFLIANFALAIIELTKFLRHRHTDETCTRGYRLLIALSLLPAMMLSTQSLSLSEKFRQKDNIGQQFSHKIRYLIRVSMVVGACYLLVFLAFCGISLFGL